LADKLSKELPHVSQRIPPTTTAAANNSNTTTATTTATTCASTSPAFFSYCNYSSTAIHLLSNHVNMTFT